MSGRPQRPSSVEGRAARAATRLGAVLCGGDSRRMGADKACLDLGDATLLEHALRTLDDVTGTVVLASGAEPRYTELGREVVLDRAPGLGPLAGLEAALARLVEGGAAEDELLAVLACDMPFARAGLFDALVARVEEQDADLALLRGSEGIEPLCAVYRARCLAPVRAALDRGERALRSFHGDVHVAHVTLAELPAELAARGTTNLNTPEELDRVRTEGRR